VRDRRIEQADGAGDVLGDLVGGGVAAAGDVGLHPHRADHDGQHDEERDAAGQQLPVVPDPHRDAVPQTAHHRSVWS
jgi:hypothetical protein